MGLFVDCRVHVLFVLVCMQAVCCRVFVHLLGVCSPFGVCVYVCPCVCVFICGCL